MRPVTRNSWPLKPNGDRKTFAVSNYKGFFKDLVINFGFYCSYCERPDSLDIEHVIPQSSPAGQHLVVDWNNLLLGCPSCNRDHKSNINNTRNGYVWPDEVDSFSHYEYFSSGDLKVKSTLDNADKTKAQATIDLCGLAPPPKSNANQSKDFLWQQRMKVWVVAEKFKADYIAGNTTVGNIVTFSEMSGFWSIWITVFSGHDDVINAISDAYNGTKSDYCTPP